MKGRYKKLITDINRGADIDNNLLDFVNSLKGEYNYYSTIKMCLNYYTMCESVSELENKKTDACKIFNNVTDLIVNHIINRKAVDEASIKCVDTLRKNIEHKMKNLTSYTDGYEIYEYILNRVEAGINGTVEEVDPELLSQKMFRYVFSENDTVVINSKLQLLMAQLPVRMTKVKFFDIIAKTLNIYEAGEKTSVDEFVDMLRTAVLIKKPEGFETEYPSLFSAYEDLKNADYKDINKEQYDRLVQELDSSAATINSEVSLYMLLQEIINDVYTILLTLNSTFDGNIADPAYKAAVTILDGCTKRADLEQLAADLMPQFMRLEGVQEDAYEGIIILEASLGDIRQANKEKINELGLSSDFDILSKASKLLSTSLFIDLDRDYDSVDREVADHEYIIKLRDEFTGELESLFDGKPRKVIRSIMCKLLAAMPIFMNTQQEIKDYFEYVLNNCKDDSELTACNKLICEIIEEE